MNKIILVVLVMAIDVAVLYLNVFVASNWGKLWR